jgi:hypothetical protein
MLINPVQVQGLSSLITQVSNLATTSGTHTTDISTINGSLTTLSNSLTSLQNKSIKDVVRVVYSATFDSSLQEWSASTLDTITGLTQKSYPVYLLDNRPVLKANGEQLYYDTSNGTFNGVPSVLDMANSTESSKAYTPITTDFDFKIFPEGTWTLSTLPESALLDNQELSLIAYETALQNVVISLAKDRQLITQIQNLVGETAIATQLSGKFDKADIVDSTVDTSASGYTSSDSKVLSEKAVLNLLDDMNTAISSAVSGATDFVRKDSLVNEVKASGGSTTTTINEATLVTKFAALDTSISNITGGVDSAAAAVKVRQYTQNVTGNTAVTTITPSGITMTEVLYITINGIAYVASDGFSVSSGTITLDLPFTVDGTVTDKVVIYYLGSVNS